MLGLTYSTTRDELCRAFVDAVALSALDHADRLRAAGVDPARWRVAGGATRNAALLHACCDALGRPLDVMPHAGAAIGPAALALRAAGAHWQPSPERTIEPDAATDGSLRRAAGGLPRRLRTARVGRMRRLSQISPSKGEARPLGGLHGDDVNIDAAQHPFWDVMWTFFLIWIWVSWIWLVIVVIGDIIRRRDLSTGAKAAWGIIVLILPLVGALIYLISQGGKMAERRAQREYGGRL